MARPATQRLILHKVLSLPTPVLRLMSGGGVVYQGGRTLDPRLQFLAAQARGTPPITLMTPEEARRVLGLRPVDARGDGSAGALDRRIFEVHAGLGVAAHGGQALGARAAGLLGGQRGHRGRPPGLGG